MKIYLTFLSSFFLFINYTFSQISLSQAGSLLAPRWFHESQVLPNGKVLVFGGNNGDLLHFIPYKSAELYDPATDTWSSTGSMSHERELFASVVLNNGKVLAIGGSSIDTTCEIYDPATGTWTPAASMKEMNEKAIKLNDGRVLAVSMSTSEIYDPYTNKWQYVDTLSVLQGRDFSLALLDDGKVLLTGGSNKQTTAELFDPVTNSWRLLPVPLEASEKNHNSVRLTDGRVLLTGGDGGFCQIYDPANNTFTITASLLVDIGGNQSILMDNGNVLVYGIGDFSNLTDTKCIQTYNPSTGVWSAGGVYNFVGRNYYTFCKLKNGKILIAGGSATTGNGASTDCLLITPSEFSGCTQPNLALSLNSTSVCYGKSPSVTINGSESGVTYTAFISGTKASNSSPGPGTLTLNLNASLIQPGNNIVSILAKKAGCATFFLNNTATINSSLSIASKPELNPASEVVVCSGDSIKLSTTSGYSSYRWSNGKITSSPALFVKPTTSVNVKYVDGAGCTSVASDFVKVFTPLIAKGGPDAYTCADASAFLLTDYSPKGGTWSGTGVSPNGTFSPSSVGVGTYVLIYKICGLSTTKTVIVNPTTIPPVTAHFIKDTICYYGVGTLEIENSQPGVIYTLREGSTEIAAQNGTGGTLSFSTSTILATTTLNVLSSITNSCGTFTAVSYHKIMVAPNEELAVTVTKPLICRNEKTFVVINASEKGVSYQLKMGFQEIYTPVIGNGGSAKIEVGPLTAAQTYTITATYHGCDPRNLVATATVGMQQPDSYYAPRDFNVQPGQYISFENHSYNPLGTYTWNFGTGASIVTSSLQQPDSIYYAQPGSYPVSLITTSPIGCKDTLLRTINVFSYNKKDSCVAARGHFDSSRQPFPVALVNDKDDNTFLYAQTDGTFGEIAVFSKYKDTIRVGSKSINTAGNILIKYNRNGTPDWIVPITHKGSWTRPGSMDVDSNGDVYVTYFHGEYTDSIRFYSVDNRCDVFIPPHDDTQTSLVVYKYNSKGYFQWARTALDFYTCLDPAIRVDPKGFLYVGSLRNFCKYNLNGDTLWQFYDPASLNGGIHGIEIDNKNNVHVLKQDFMHIEKYDPNGNLLSATDPPTDLGGLYIESSHLKLDDQGNGYTAGCFTGKLSFAANTYLSNTGQNNVNGFLAAYDVITGKQKWFVQLKLATINGQIRTMGIDFKNGVGIVTGIIFSYNEILQIGNQTIQFPKGGYFSFNFNAAGNIYNFNILASPSPSQSIYTRDLVTFNKMDNNTTVCFDFEGSVRYGGITYPALAEGAEFIILKGNASCLSPVVTSISIDPAVSNDSYAMKIFPNPAGSQEQIYISVSSDLKEKAILTVTDITGKEIGSRFGFNLDKGVNQIQIPMDVTRELNSGVYFIQLSSPSINKEVKLMID
jgi:hypothetical protein